MPHVFTENVTIRTVNFPGEEKAAGEIQREANFLSNTKTHISFLDVARNILHAGVFEEVAYDPKRHFSLWVKSLNPDASLVETYNLFLCSIHRFTVSELLLTRETVLDHSSKLLARLSCFGDALNLLGEDVRIEAPPRTAIVAGIFKAYDSILTSMVAVQELLHGIMHLRNSLERHDPVGGVLKGIVDRWPGGVLSELRESVEASCLYDAETAFINGRCLETKEAFLKTAFRSVEVALRQAHDQIEGIGLNIIDVFEKFLPSEDVKSRAHEVLRNAVLTEEEVFLFQHQGILSWTDPSSEEGLLQSAQAVLGGVHSEFSAILSTLDSHDQMRQMLQHRLAELHSIEQNTTSEEFIPLLASNAVTLLERLVVSSYFKHFDSSGLLEYQNVADPFSI